MLASHPAAGVRISEFTKKLLMLLRLEESGQWLENAERTHLVLVSGKPVLQKRYRDEMILVNTGNCIHRN